jgi:Ca2+-binding EF-hand superfamily protein
MAEYTERWTPDAVAQFEKYDLNHDGIITADEVLEVLKVGKPRGRR